MKNTAQPAPREADRRPYAERQHPYMWADYTELPPASLSFDMCDTRIIAPYCVTLRFFAQGHYLHPGRRDHGDALSGRHILPDDVLIFDRDRTTPEDDAIMLVKDGGDWVPRVCKILADGFVEFHAAAPAYPILSGEREIVGTLAAVVRATDGKAVQP